MTLTNEVIHKQKGYRLHIVKTEKYKTNTIVWKMKAPLSEDSVTLRGLLPHVLQSSSNAYPTTTKLRSYLDELYGAHFFVDVGKKGEQHVMSFSIELANEKFLKDQTPLLEKAIAFLKEILLQPLLEDGAFHKETVQKEKENQLQRIESIYDDKMRYANSRITEEMFKGEAFSMQPYGIKGKVDPITPRDLFDYYEKAINEDDLDLYIVGDVEESEVIELTNRYIQLPERTGNTRPKGEGASRSNVKEVIDRQPISQGKLNMGYRTFIQFGDQDYYALQVFNGIFGGFSHSKLFANVREKASLAYYAASRLESHKGVMMVMSGIDFPNYNQAVTIINEQLGAMRQGDFSEEDIRQTKAVIINQLLETIDTSRGLVEVLYHNVVSGVDIELTTWIEKIDATTKDEIVQAAKKVQLDTIYFLTEQEGA